MPNAMQSLWAISQPSAQVHLAGWHTWAFLSTRRGSLRQQVIDEPLEENRTCCRFTSRAATFSVSGQAPFSRLIYPMRNEAGLGVHLTLDLGGQVRFGPDLESVDT